MRWVRPRRTLAIIAFTLASCSSQLVPAATPTVPIPPLRLYVTPPVADLVNMLTTSYSRQNPGITFDVTVGGERAMLTAAQDDPFGYLITGYLDEGIDLWAAPIGQDGIGLIAHPDTGVDDLSLDDVRAIYAGEVERWSRFGGSNTPLIPFTREEGAGIQDALIRQVLGALPVDTNVRIAPSDAAMRFAVERTAGAIGYVPVSQLDGRESHALTIDGIAPTLENVYAQQYPLRTILYIAGVREPDSADPLGQHYRAFIGWIQSPDGQALVSRRAAPLLQP